MTKDTHIPVDSKGKILPNSTYRQSVTTTNPVRRQVSEFSGTPLPWQGKNNTCPVKQLLNEAGVPT